MKQHTFLHTNGQAMITVLFISIIGLIVTTGAVYALMINTSISSLDERGALAHSAAESGIENAILRLIRDPNYTGETFMIDTDRTVTVAVTGTSPQIITATASMGSITQRVQVQVAYNGGILTIQSWRNLP